MRITLYDKQCNELVELVTNTPTFLFHSYSSKVDENQLGLREQAFFFFFSFSQIVLYLNYVKTKISIEKI